MISEKTKHQRYGVYLVLFSDNNLVTYLSHCGKTMHKFCGLLEKAVKQI